MKKVRFVVGLLGVFIALTLLFFSIVCPFTFTSIPRSALPKDFQDGEKEISVEGDKAAWKYDFLGNNYLFVSLAQLDNQQKMVSIFSPETNSFYQRLLEWEKVRTAHVLYPIADLRGETTRLIFMTMCVLIDRGDFSYVLQNSLERQLLEAPEKKWGEFELSAIAVLYLSKRFSVLELSKMVVSLENPAQLVTLAAFLQNMPHFKNEILKLINLFPSRYLDRLFRYIVKWKEQGINDLLIVNKQLNDKAMIFLVKKDVLLGFEWPLFIPENSLLVQWVNQLFRYDHNFVASVRYVALFIGVFFLFISLQFMYFPLRVSAAMFFIMIALFATLSFYLVIEKQGAAKDELPSLIMAPKMSTELLFSKSKAIKGDLVMSILPVVFTIIFLVIQILIFLLGKRQVNKIKKVSIGPVTKLKLIENEDHLFDMGLYIGLTGTILSFILLALDWAMVGLISAYTSTLFGIIEVTLLKLLYVRPYKRKLILQISAD